MNDPLLVQLSLPRADFTLEVNLQLPPRGITVLFGASGSGKTSMLRCVAGLERAHSATVRVAGETWQNDSQRVFLPTYQRALGYVFQEASLLEHLDVQGNLQYGMKRTGARLRGGAASQTLDTAIALLGIEHLLQRRPADLSGGERQRVAIARALATDPRILLLDEPMASLDLARRHEILPWLEKLRDELSIPMLYVTHSPDELARLANHLVVLEKGRVKAAGPVQDVMGSLHTSLVVGDDAGVLLQGTVAERSTQWQLARVAFDGGELWLRDSGAAIGAPVRLRVYARDVSLALQAPPDTTIQNLLSCVIEGFAPDTHPSQVMVRLRCNHVVLLARITRRAQHELALHEGTRVWALVKSAALVT